MNFEEKKKELDKIVSSLENNEIPLNESVELFNNASKLIKECYEIIAENEGKVFEVKSDLDKIVKEEIN